MQYREYMQSVAWRTCAARLEELKLSGFRCRACNLGRNETELHVHHRTYERLGQELLADLTTLCVECHGVITCLLRGRRYATRSLLVVPDYQPALANCGSLSDLALRGGRA